MTIYDKVIAAKKDYSEAIKYLVIGAAAQFEKCKPIKAKMASDGKSVRRST